MTQEQTRKLAIEFERRIQAMFPQEVLSKISTDTIFSFLNEYQVIYIKQLILSGDQIQNNSQASSTRNEILKSLIKHAIVSWEYTPPTHLQDEAGWREDIGDVNCKIFDLPSDYFQYIRSSSIVARTYKDPAVDEQHLHYLQNVLVSQDTIDTLIQKPYNKGAIMRKPHVVLENIYGVDILKVFYDQYTGLSGIDLTYYSTPYKFNIIGYNDNNMSKDAVHSVCHLPESCFEDLVNGAVQLYVNYKLGAQPKKEQKKEDDKQ